MKDGLITELKSIQTFFKNSTDCLDDSNGDFKATEGSLSVTQQVAHIAQSIDWFIDGMKSPEGFNMNFDEHWEIANKCKSLSEAREWFDRSIENAISTVQSMSEEELMSPLPEGEVMGGAPKMAVISGISDHTAHHRGALTVYARLLGKEPKMPYM